MKILVVGSSNTDMVVKANHLPLPGETILGGKFFMNPGGKGANQAVASARLGGIVTFIAKTGNDIFGKQSIELFNNEGIYTQYLLTDSENPSGVALITVDENAENCIVVAPGSNGTFSVTDFEKCIDSLSDCDYVLMQLEIPLETVMFIAKKAHQMGKKVILNPAPAQELPDELYKNIYLLIPNQTEAEMLCHLKIFSSEDIEKTGLISDTQKSLEQAAKVFIQKGVQNVVITLGSEGAYIYNKEQKKIISGYKVKAVDTTAAGDTFCGAITVALAEGKSLEKAVEFANKAASISVTRLGAQTSIPYRKELY